jgi:hypothetical protein
VNLSGALNQYFCDQFRNDTNLWIPGNKGISRSTEYFLNRLAGSRFFRERAHSDVSKEVVDKSAMFMAELV